MVVMEAPPQEVVIDRDKNHNKNNEMRFVIFFILTITLLSCAKKPNYSEIPQISYKSFNILSQDSAIITITFSDKNGDIGSLNQEGNFFITYYFWDNSLNKYVVFSDTTLLNDTIDARSFPSPSDAYKNKPISGEISLLMYPYRIDNTIKKLKYTCYIKDNAGNQSNIVQTPELYAP